MQLIMGLQKFFILLSLTLFLGSHLGCSHFQKENKNKNNSSVKSQSKSNSKINFKTSFVKVKKSFKKMGKSVSKWGAKSYQLSYDKACIYTKAAFDVGSGTTKMKVAQVDVCKKKILKVFLKKQIPVAYKENLVSSKKGKIFNSFIQKKGFKVLKRLAKQAKKFKPHKWVGVGTSAFRKANNAKAFLKKVKKDIKLDIKIITQKEEGEIGFFAAKTLLSKLSPLKIKNKKIVVWDIGGGSMQMISPEKRKISNFFLKKWTFYKGTLASVSFKKHIIKNIQKKPYKKSPNPMSNWVAKKAERYVINHAKKTIPKGFKKIFKEKFILLGIGGVHYHSIFKQIKKSVKRKKTRYYTKYQLQKTLNRRKNLSNKKIGGRYASTDISNLILVLGFMKSLKINKIYTGQVDLTDGVLLYL